MEGFEVLLDFENSLSPPCPTFPIELSTTFHLKCRPKETRPSDSPRKINLSSQHLSGMLQLRPDFNDPKPFSSSQPHRHSTGPDLQETSHYRQIARTTHKTIPQA